MVPPLASCLKDVEPEVGIERLGAMCAGMPLSLIQPSAPRVSCSYYGSGSASLSANMMPWGMGMGQWDPAMIMLWQQCMSSQSQQAFQPVRGSQAHIAMEVKRNFQQVCQEGTSACPDTTSEAKKRRTASDERSEHEDGVGEQFDAAPRSPTSPCPSEEPQADDKNDTPPTIRKLLVLASEGNETMPRDEAVTRLAQLAKEAERRMSASKETAMQPVALTLTVSNSGAKLGMPYYQQQQALEAKRAIQGLMAAVSEAVKKAACTAHIAQMNVKFVQPVASAAELRAKIEHFHGAAGPLLSPWMNPLGSIPLLPCGLQRRRVMRAIVCIALMFLLRALRAKLSPFPFRWL